jgi:hypothetical protein
MLVEGLACALCDKRHSGTTNRQEGGRRPRGREPPPRGVGCTGGRVGAVAPADGPATKRLVSPISAIQIRPHLSPAVSGRSRPVMRRQHEYIFSYTPFSSQIKPNMVNKIDEVCDATAPRLLTTCEYLRGRPAAMAEAGERWRRRNEPAGRWRPWIDRRPARAGRWGRTGLRGPDVPGRAGSSPGGRPIRTAPAQPRDRRC